MVDGLVINRSKLTYGETKRILILRMKLQKAEKELDVDALEKAMNEMGALIEKPIVSVPASYFVEEAPAEALALQPGWLDWISQEAFLELQNAAAEAANPGNLKAPGINTT